MGIYSRFLFPRLCDLVLGQARIAKLRRELLAQVRDNILEIGFGTGLNLPHYPPRIGRLTTIDPHGDMHLLAGRRLRRSPIVVEHLEARAECLPFGDGVFSTVVSSFTLCGIPQVELALAEIHRVLRPGGRFLFLEHGLSPNAAVQVWQRRLNWLEMKLAGGCRLDRDIRSLVAAGAFAAISVESFHLPRTPKSHGYLYRGVAEK